MSEPRASSSKPKKKRGAWCRGILFWALELGDARGEGGTNVVGVGGGTGEMEVSGEEEEELDPVEEVKDEDVDGGDGGRDDEVKEGEVGVDKF